MHWNSIGIIGKRHAAEQSLATCQKLLRLCSIWQMPVHCEQELGMLLELPAELYQPIDRVVVESDLILVVGGDGSMLHAAQYALQHNKPVIGINRGQLGFLTDIGPEELSDRLYQVLDGAYWLEQRSLIEITIWRNEQLLSKEIALNDIVLSLGASSQLIEFDLWIDDCFVCRQRADGLIVATPTGSTAYALSAGGPIIHPELNAMAIVPMLPHKLNTRPIVVSADVAIKIILQSEHQNAARVSFDSYVQCALLKNDTILIRQCKKKLKLVHPNDYDYFQTLRDKLHWENY